LKVLALRLPSPPLSLSFLSRRRLQFQAARDVEFLM
jgi:hypothetical protein